MASPNFQFSNITIASATPKTLNLTGTTAAGDICYTIVYVKDNAQSVTSVTSDGISGNLNSRVSGSGVYVHWGAYTGATTNPVITFNLSGNKEMVVFAGVVRGCGSSTSPFDPNASVPAIISGNNATYTTDFPNDLLLWDGFNQSTSEPTRPTGWTNIQTQNYFNNASQSVAVLSESSTVTSLTPTGTGTIDRVLVDAFTADVPAATAIFTVNGSLVSTGRLAEISTANIAASGSLTAGALLNAEILANLIAAGALTAETDLPPHAGLVGEGSIIADTTAEAQTGAALGAVGGLATTGSQILPTDAVLTAAGSLVADATQIVVRRPNAAVTVITG